MRVLFMGTPEFAVPTLEAINKSGFDIAGVITQPDRPGGRGKKLRPSPVKKAALEMGLPVLQPERIKEPGFIEKIGDISPDVVVVVAFGQILHPGLLNLPPNGCVNVHASLLPRYRGAAPIHRAVINGETETGVTTMFMNQGLDTGDMLLKAKIVITGEDTVGTVHDRLAALGADLLVETLNILARGNINRTPQDNRLATYAPMLTPADEMIVWEDSARSIFNLVRGMDPWPGARTNWGEKVLKIWRARLIPGYSPAGDHGEGLSPGTVTGAGPEGLTVMTGTGPLLITEMQVQGGKRLNASDFLRGNAIPPGTVLKTIPYQKAAGSSAVVNISVNSVSKDTHQPDRYDPGNSDVRHPATDHRNKGGLPS